MTIQKFERSSFRQYKIGKQLKVSINNNIIEVLQKNTDSIDSQHFYVNKVANRFYLGNDTIKIGRSKL